MDVKCTGIPKAGSDSQLDGLILKIASGDPDGMTQLYSRTRAAVYGLALSYLRNPADAEDVTQDTFVQVWNAAPDYKANGHAMAWLMTITKNMALGHLRAKQRETTLEPEQWEQLPDASSAVSEDDKLLLDFLLRGLTEEECRIVTLHALTGLKHREIAELTGLSLPTVLSKYRRSLKKLNARLEGENRS